MRSISVGAILLLAYSLGFGEISGTAGFRADGRGATGLSVAAILNVDFSLDPFTLGANLSLPLPGLDWNLTLRGRMGWDPFRLSSQVGVSPHGLAFLHQDLRFLPDPWVLEAGEARASTQLDLYIRDLMGTPSASLIGSASGYASWEDLWMEASLGINLYPFPPHLGRRDLAFGYQLQPFWITSRNHFLGGWSYSSVELGYQEPPLRVTVQVAFGPEGFRRVGLSLSFAPDPARFSLNTAATPQGPSPTSLTFGFVDEGMEGYLRATMAFPFGLRGVGFEVRVPF